VIALARVMEGTDTALRYAQQAENEANAPRLFVPFYSFVEKAREGASIEEQQLAFADGVGLMLDYLSLGTMSLAMGSTKTVESAATREAVRTGKLATGKAAQNAGRRGNAFTRFFYDPRNYKHEIGPAYWASRGPAKGRSLHHWLFPQRATGVPVGIRNAGWNTFELPPMRGIFHRSLDLNGWMGFARRWKGAQPKVAAAVENGIRVAIPTAAAGAGYAGYKAGSAISEWLWVNKR
jgi:hypothetical protein